MVDLDIGLGAHAQTLDRLLAYREEARDLPPEDRLALERQIGFCLLRLGRLDEARSVVHAALEAVPAEVSALERARCLVISSKASLEIGFLPGARADALAALDTLGEGSQTEEAGLVRNLLGTVAVRSGQPELAHDHFEKALEIFRKLGDLRHLAGCYRNLGNLHKLRCDWERATEHYYLAYYLGTTLGESMDVAGAAQSLGIVLSKLGRYREARTSLERGLKLAVETGDTPRSLRARIALAKLNRSEFLTQQARGLLEACRAAEGKTLPEREHCLLLLEEARLDLDEGNLVAAPARVSELRLRVEAMAPRGDLMVEVLLLEADMAAAEDRWTDVAEATKKAADLAGTDRDRAQEERALAGLAMARAHAGRVGEADARLRGLAERHRARGEWPALASTLRAMARIASRVRGDRESALRLLREAGELYRRMDVPRGEAIVEAEQVRCLIELGRRDEARTQIANLRRVEEKEGPFPLLSREIEALNERLERGDAESQPGGPDGLQVHERLEEILSGPGSAWERLHEILALLREALELDGVFLARVNGPDLEMLATSGVDLLRGRRVVPAGELGLDGAAAGAGAEARPPADEAHAGSARAVNRMTIPMQIRGKPHLLFMQRLGSRGRGPLGRAERNYAMVLVAEVARALDLGPQDAEASAISRGIALADVITQDARVLKILDLIRRVATSDLTVLLQGETGTGKKLLAHAIHRSSHRSERPIVTVDCAALPDSLLEAELFGYRKGAFTGAMQDRAGLLAEASGGTVFLDEIDKAGLGVQRRFLHLLDSGEIRPVGATTYVRLDIRIVGATSCPDLRTEVAEGRFLKDLYYRLNDISIEIPPLRERRDDVLLLAGCFLESFASQAGRRIRGMSSRFRRALLAHDWPGNVRELEKVIRRAVTLADDDEILTPDLLPRDLLEVITQPQDEPGDNLRKRVDSFERRAIEHALEVCNGNKSRAAAMLGLTRKGLKGKLARYAAAQRRPADA